LKAKGEKKSTRNIRKKKKQNTAVYPANEPETSHRKSGPSFIKPQTKKLPC